MNTYLTREDLRARRAAKVTGILASFPETTLRQSNQHLFGPVRWPCGHIKHARNVRHIGDGREQCGICRQAVDQRYRARKAAHA